MPLIEPIIRPPAEADSLLLQVTTGCSANTCTFCGAYTDKPFRILPFAVIRQDIREAAAAWPAARRVFLLDGDALVLGNDKLIPVLDELQAAFPRLSRIASYANGDTITARCDGELQALAARKLTLVYIGLESGSQALLDARRKRATVAQMVEAVQRAAAAGIRSSVIVLLGLGGQEHSAEHVRETITALNAMQPHYLSFLSLMLIPDTPLAEEAARSTFRELDAMGMLREAREILAGLELRRTVFRCDHASNFLSLAGRLPTDKNTLLAQLDAALSGRQRLRPWFLRGL